MLVVAAAGRITHDVQCQGGTWRHIGWCERACQKPAWACVGQLLETPFKSAHTHIDACEDGSDLEAVRPVCRWTRCST